MSKPNVRPVRQRIGATTRRELLRRGALGATAIAVSPLLARCGGDADLPTSLLELGPLGEPDANGLRLPAGATSRIIGVAGELVAGTDYEWHAAPDGGATFETDDGGWIYVSNSERLSGGGASAVRFDAGGAITDAYRILDGTALNCAGGATPWGTWLSCEEIPGGGSVWECDPTGEDAAVERPALGIFRHEAVAVDPTTGTLYLTEDETDGRLYRYTPDVVSGGVSDLENGTLEVLRVLSGTDGPVTWDVVPDPSATGGGSTRSQVPASTAFNGGEGIAYADGFIYFTTKGDDRIWAYSIADESLEIVYDAEALTDPILKGVDNIAVSSGGDLLVCEDGDDMQVVAITPDGTVVPIAQVEGHGGSEITGVAIDPSGRRVYFSSQRGENGIFFTSGGVTYEVTLPFAL